MNRFFLLLFLFTANAWSAGEDYARTTKDGRGAVASVNPIATQAGIDAFAAGGNAIDAALAVAFTLGVVDSHNSGIGGGCFIVVRQADGTVLAIDGREMAPAKAHRDMFKRDGKVDPSLSKTGALAIGIPGSVAALHHVQKSGGKLSFEQVVLPAAAIADQGFAVDSVFTSRLLRNTLNVKKFPATAAIFLNDKGVPLQTGDTLVQKDLAVTYRKLAKEGPDYFYQGAFAQAVDKWMKANGGIVTQKDFSNYKVLQREPVISQFEEYRIVGFPPPSSGGVHVAQILNILSHFPLTDLSEVDRYHVIIEAMKLAFADRAYWLGDPDFAKVPKGLIDAGYAKSLANTISLKGASKVRQHSVPPKADSELFGKHTTHISTADKDGNWVAITTTLNTSFGSKVVIPGTGVLMNNQMDDFSAQPGMPNAYGLVGAEANSVQAGKRPLSSMSPTLVFKGEAPVLSVGAAGGPTIITQVLQTLVNHLILQKPLEEAMRTVRVHHQWLPDQVYYDHFADKALLKGLEKKGHRLKVWPPFGATQAITLGDVGFTAVTEPRLVDGMR